MANLGTTFDATQHDTTQREYTPLPDGDYRLEVTDSDVVPTKSGDGMRITGAYTVVEPDAYKDRKVFFGINIQHTNAQAQEIGQREFAALCRAVGASNVTDTEELHYKAFMARVGMGKPSKDGQYPARNEIKRFYFPDEGDLPEPKVSDTKPAANDNKPATRAAAAATPAATTGAPKARPWGRAA